VPGSEKEWEEWFDRSIERHDSGSLKRDKYSGSPDRRNIIPLWVADMDFEAPPQVTERLFSRAVGHRVYGYTRTSPHFNDANESVVNYMQRDHGVRVSE
jgi:cysteine-S-conjugate beta-lyase